MQIIPSVFRCFDKSQENCVRTQFLTELLGGMTEKQYFCTRKSEGGLYESISKSV